MINVGDVVEFRTNRYADEDGAYYRVKEVNGDRCLIEFISNLAIPSTSIARVRDLIVSKVIPEAYLQRQAGYQRR